MLRVWLPLTRDLRNQGLDDVAVTNNGATFNSSGKLGGCYSFGNGSASSNGLFLNSNLVDLMQEEYSVAVWVKPLGNHYHYNGTIFSSGNWNNTCYAFGLSQDNSQVDILCKGYNTYLTCAVPINTWTHLVCTCDSSNVVRLYKNGEYIGSSTRSNKPDSDNTTQAAIGRETYASGYFTFNGMLNDFRLYDHCLSPMEVKELSKGLVLHYPLDRNGWGQENLLSRYVVPGQAAPTSTAAGGRTTWLGDYKITIPATENADTYFRLFTTKQLTTNATYTISCKVSGLLSGTCYNFPLYAQNNTSMGVLQLNHNGLCSLTFTMTYGTQTAATGASGETVYICFMDDSARSIASGQGAITVSDFKLEEGSVATPWCPNSSDTLATTMGLNSTTEYDCSGFCNNGTRTGTFTWTSNTPKYAVSQIFNGTDNAIQTPSLPTMITDKNYTIAVWIYKTVIGSKGYQTIYGGPSGFEIEARNGSANETKFVPWNWGKPMASYELNEWNHCVFVHSDADCKIYLNGEYIATGTAKASNPTGNYFVGAWNTATQQNFDGLMSDFRIYATALSADDVKSLYQNSAYIDSSGNVYGTIHES